MKKIVNKFLLCVLFSLSISLSHRTFAQVPDQSQSDPDVLVSSPDVRAQVSDQGGTGHKNSSADAGEPSQDNPGDHGKSETAPKPSTDEIIIKATDAVMFQMTANLKMTQDQISAVRPIVEDNIIKVRDLQKSLESGSIDGKTMYDQRQQLTQDEYQKLGLILTQDQMKVWINIQNQS
jgi:hypothetical protein